MDTSTDQKENKRKFMITVTGEVVITEEVQAFINNKGIDAVIDSGKEVIREHVSELSDLENIVVNIDVKEG